MTTFITPAVQQPVGPTRIRFILDRSGSMASMLKDAIGGFNSFIKSQQEATAAGAEDPIFTLVQFDDKYEVHQDRVPMSKAQLLDQKTFMPRGSTGLLDAIGRSLTEELANPAGNVIVAILTDGGENASREFTGETVRALIKRAQDELGWDINFLGANIDAFSVASDYGIKLSKVATFDVSAQGANAAFSSISASATAYRGGSRDFDVTSTYASLRSGDAEAAALNASQFKAAMSKKTPPTK